jgi:hypothetical protein
MAVSHAVACNITASPTTSTQQPVVSTNYMSSSIIPKSNAYAKEQQQRLLRPLNVIYNGTNNSTSPISSNNNNNNNNNNTAYTDHLYMLNNGNQNSYYVCNENNASGSSNSRASLATPTAALKKAMVLQKTDHRFSHKKFTSNNSSSSANNTWTDQMLLSASSNAVNGFAVDSQASFGDAIAANSMMLMISKQQQGGRDHPLGKIPQQRNASLLSNYVSNGRHLAAAATQAIVEEPGGLSVMPLGSGGKAKSISINGKSYKLPESLEKGNFNMLDMGSGANHHQVTSFLLCLLELLIIWILFYKF